MKVLLPILSPLHKLNVVGVFVCRLVGAARGGHVRLARQLSELAAVDMD